MIQKQMEIDIAQFKEVFDLETHRRDIFFKLCSTKVNLEKIRNNMNRLKSGKAVKLSDISSSTNSLIETKMSPNDSFETSSNNDEKYELLTSVKRSYSIKKVNLHNKDDDLIQSSHFLYVQRGCLTLPLVKDFKCIPIDEHDSYSILAYTLSTLQYQEFVNSKINPALDKNDQIENDLLSGNEEHFQFQISTYDEAEFNELAHKDDMRRLYGPHLSINVIAFFPLQFHAIRNYLCGSDEEFLTSIFMAQNNHFQPGKSGATFRLSHDGKYILKTVDEKAVRMFIDLAPNYFRHICKNYFHNMPSLLVKTLGAYKVYVKNQGTGRSRLEFLLLFENLGFNMPDKCFAYDLKGTANSRRKVKQGDKRTKMDINFLDDFFGVPLTVQTESKRIFDAAI